MIDTYPDNVRQMINMKLVDDRYDIFQKKKHTPSRRMHDEAGHTQKLEHSYRKKVRENSQSNSPEKWSPGASPNARFEPSYHQNHNHSVLHSLKPIMD